MKCSLGISHLLEEISSLSILLFTSISLHWSLRKTFLSFLAVLWNSAFKWVNLSFLFFFAFCFFSQLFVRPCQITILPFCISFSWGWSWSLLPIQCREPLSIVLQALYLLDLIPWNLTDAEDNKMRWQEYTDKLYKKILMTQITTMVWSLT